MNDYDPYFSQNDMGPVYDTYTGQGPRRLIHWEPWSNPDAATYITGINFYQRPRSCMLRLTEIYPFLYLSHAYIPKNDEPLPTPDKERDTGKGRWGHAYRDFWQQEAANQHFSGFKAMLNFSPLENADFRNWTISVAGDYRDEETVYQRYRATLPAEWGDKAPDRSPVKIGFYNTLFMWPMQIFGYENFLNICLEPEFNRIMDEFAEISRRVFRSFARLPVNFVTCHDDIVTPAGPLCSPAWLRKHIFPRYQEYWGILKDAGKRVFFLSDGCLDMFVDDIMACGATGIISEPFTNFKAVARRYKDILIAGEGDVRVLMRNNPEEIKKMVLSMVETGRMSGGYIMRIGNLIPFNIPPDAVKRYLDLSRDLGYR